MAEIKTFSHRGDLGDTIAGLTVIRDFGGGHLVLYPGTAGKSAVLNVRDPYTPEKFKRIRSFFELQPYLAGVSYSEAPQGEVLDEWREVFDQRKNPRCRLVNTTKQIQQLQHEHFRLPPPNPELPWCVVDERIPVAPIVIHRSPRYHGKDFPWKEIATRKDVVMVGSVEEHQAFCEEFGEVPHYQTATLLDLARVIAGCELFIGNQSAPRWVAESLKVPVWIEQYNSQRHNTYIERRKAAYDGNSFPAFFRNTDSMMTEIDQYKWWHQIKLPGGIITPGECSHGRTTEELRKRWAMPASFAGKTVMDVGCWDGLFSLHAVHNQAKQVISIDVLDRPTLRLVRQAHRIDEQIWQFYVQDAQQGLPDVADVVLCFGVLYHVEDPKAVMDHICKAARETVIIETALCHQLGKPNRGHTEWFHAGPGGHAGDPTNFWYPGVDTILHELKLRGFEGKLHHKAGEARATLVGVRKRV